MIAFCMSGRSLPNASPQPKNLSIKSIARYACGSFSFISCFNAILRKPSLSFCNRQDYSKADAIMQAMHLTDAETEMLNCYMSGWKQTQVCLFLGITRGTINYRRSCIQIQYLYRRELNATLDSYLGSFLADFCRAICIVAEAYRSVF